MSLTAMVAVFAVLACDDYIANCNNNIADCDTRQQESDAIPSAAVYR
jgi:hypothetical protein